MIKKALLVCLFILFSGFLFHLPLPAEDPPDVDDKEELEIFMDGIMNAHLSSHNLPGATLAIVQEDEILLLKGYGYSDVEKRLPVDPGKNLFRTGSTGKLFTWTAVMQLAEQGKLDLDADINTYLNDFKIPETFPQPITMKHLMSHTPGFEDSFTGLFTHKSEEIVPLGQYLAEHMPARVRPPGQFTAYSNYGTALAGYIVELIAGMPYEKYLRDNLFKPLEMTHTTCTQPPGGSLGETMAVAYKFENGWHKKEKFEIFRSLVPAGIMSTTARDMAHFMIAHLEEGEYEGERILKEETIRQMHTRHFTHAPQVNGNAHGFWENHMNGLRIIEHGGDTIYYHTLMALIPEKKIGIFVSYNSPGSHGIPRYRMLKAFMDRYFPAATPPTIKPAADAEKELKKYTGYYRFIRSNYSSYEKIIGLLGAFSISTTNDGYLLTSRAIGGGTLQWAYLEPGVFRKRGSMEKLAFRLDTDGQVTHMFFGDIPYAAGERLAWYEAPPFSVLLIILCFILFGSTLRWTGAAIGRAICKTRQEPEKSHGLARWFGGGLGFIYIVFLLGLIISSGDDMTLIYGVPTMMKIILYLPYLAALLTFFVLLYTLIAWKNKYWTFCSRIHYTLLFPASLAFLWFLYYWNLFGFHAP